MHFWRNIQPEDLGIGEQRRKIRPREKQFRLGMDRKTAWAVSRPNLIRPQCDGDGSRNQHSGADDRALGRRSQERSDRLHAYDIASPWHAARPPARSGGLPRHLTHQFRGSIGCRRRRRSYSSGFCRIITLVPTGTRSYRSATSVLTSRKQPEDTAVPMVSGRLVP